MKKAWQGGAIIKTPFGHDTTLLEISAKVRHRPGVAKFLLGPKRKVEAAAPGKPGVAQPTAEQFTEEQFRKLLFNCDPGYANQPRHLSHSFKGRRLDAGRGQQPPRPVPAGALTGLPQCRAS